MKNGTLITFYSFKGGVGRTMLLANIAWIIASNGKRVLTIDWDLDAPGLHRYFTPFLTDKDLKTTKGLVDWLDEFTNDVIIESDNGGKELDKSFYENWASKFDQYFTSLSGCEFMPNKEGEIGCIDFIPAGKQDDLYPVRLSVFNWHFFYEKFGGGLFINCMIKALKNEYDYILVDSRTGFNDTAGLCTIQLPDDLLIMFKGNNQSIIGGAQIATSVKSQWKDKTRRIFPIFSQVDVSEKEKLDAAQEFAMEKYSIIQYNYLKKDQLDTYWGDTAIPYIPWYAYEEVLATFKDKPSSPFSLLSAIERVTGYLTAGKITALRPPPSKVREKALLGYSRIKKQLSPTARLQETKPAVYLALVPDNLLEKYQRVKKYLQNFGVVIYPETTDRTTYLTNMTSLTSDLLKCRLFVQLLTDNPDEESMFQYQQATQIDNLEIMQWRDNQTVSEDLEPRQIYLLTAPTVHVMFLADFQKELIDKLMQLT